MLFQINQREHDMDKSLSQILKKLHDIQDGLMSLGRLCSLKSFSVRQIAEKIPLHAQTLTYIQQGKQLAIFLSQGFAIKEACIVWRKGVHPRFVLTNHENLTLDTYALDHLMRALSSSILLAMHVLLHDIRGLTVLLPLHTYLKQLINTIEYWPIESPPLEMLLGEQSIRTMAIHRACTGPKHALIDTAFTPSYSLLDENSPAYADTTHEAAAYYWGLSARECLAADMCALSLTEYDGLPVDFYVDMAKQAYDEIRHAAVCLEIANHLIAEVKQSDSEHPFHHQLKNGLPIPAEKHLYEAMWNATLEERLVLMHHDTESLGIQRIRDKMSSVISQQYPAIARQLEIIMREEITHARLGKKWLRHLVPDKTILNSTIERARMLRSLLLLTSASHYKQESLIALVKKTLGSTSNQYGLL